MYYSSLLSIFYQSDTSVQKRAHCVTTAATIHALNHELLTCTYQPSRYSCFGVQEPKIREIFAPAFRDRLVHHILIDRVQPLIDPKFIYDSYANRPGKGAHKAVQRLQGWLRKPANRYFLQLDIQSYFPSMDKALLLGIWHSHLPRLGLPAKETQFLNHLAQLFIQQDPTNPMPEFTGNTHLLKQVPAHKSLFHVTIGKGLPIGSLTSQFFANLYLNELDQFIKHKLKVKHYIRYVDDFVLLANSPQQLNQWQITIEDFLHNGLKLHLHPNKTLQQPTANGINFLGYIVYHDHILVRQRSIRAFKRRLYFFNHLLAPADYPHTDPPETLKLAKRFRSGELVPPLRPNSALLHDMLATINSYYGIFRLADSYCLRKHLYHKHFGALKGYFIPDKNYRKIKIRSWVYWRLN